MIFVTTRTGYDYIKKENLPYFVKIGYVTGLVPGEERRFSPGEFEELWWKEKIAVIYDGDQKRYVFDYEAPLENF